MADPSDIRTGITRASTVEIGLVVLMCIQISETKVPARDTSHV